MKEVVFPSLPGGPAPDQTFQFTSALFYAVRSGNVAIVQVLVRFGADLYFIQPVVKLFCTRLLKKGTAK